MASTALGTRLAGASLSLALAGVMAGCSGGAPKPAPLPSESLGPLQSSSTPTPSATGAATPPMPSVRARSEGADGARAFAQFYVSTINYAMYTGDTSAMTRWATSRCKLCSSLGLDIADVYNKGGRVQGGGWRVLDSNLYSQNPADIALLRLKVLITKQVIYSSKGAPPSASTAGQGHLEFKLIRGNGAWKVDRLGAYS